MPSVWTIFDGFFWIGVLGALCGGLGLALRAATRIKCSNCRMCFGLIDVQRDVAGEEAVDIERLAAAPRRNSGETTVGLTEANSPRPSGSAYTPSPPRGGAVLLNRL